MSVTTVEMKLKCCMYGKIWWVVDARPFSTWILSCQSIKIDKIVRCLYDHKVIDCRHGMSVYNTEVNEVLHCYFGLGRKFLGTWLRFLHKLYQGPAKCCLVEVWVGLSCYIVQLYAPWYTDTYDTFSGCYNEISFVVWLTFTIGSLLSYVTLLCPVNDVLFSLIHGAVMEASCRTSVRVWALLCGVLRRWIVGACLACGSYV